MFILSILALVLSLLLAGVGRMVVDRSEALLYHRYYRKKADIIFGFSAVFLVLAFLMAAVAIWSTFDV
jgi:hypothetical protein